MESHILPRPLDSASARVLAPPADVDASEPFDEHLQSAPIENDDNSPQHDATRGASDSPAAQPDGEPTDKSAEPSNDEEALDEESQAPVADVAADSNPESDEIKSIGLQAADPSASEEIEADRTEPPREGSGAQLPVQNEELATKQAKTEASAASIEEANTLVEAETIVESTAPKVTDSDAEQGTALTAAEPQQPIENPPTVTEHTGRGEAAARRETGANSDDAPIPKAESPDAIRASLADDPEEIVKPASGEKTLDEHVPPPASQSAPVAEQPTNRLPQNLIAPSQRSDAEPSAPRVDANRFVQRIAKALEVAQQRDGQVLLRLHPPELGSIRLEIRMQGNALNARVEAESTTARGLLMDHLPVLRERLAEQGIHVEQFDVEVPQRQAGEGGDAANEHGERRASHAHARAADELPLDDAQPNDARQTMLAPAGESELNVIV